MKTQMILPKPQRSSGKTQSRRHPARAVKVMASAGQHAKAGSSRPAANRTRKSVKASQDAPGSINIGDYRLVQSLLPGMKSVWLLNKDGEGMHITELRFALYLDLLFQLEF